MCIKDIKTICLIRCLLNLCAPGGIRTPNDGSEDRYDIHFTTGALRVLVLYPKLIINEN